MASGDDAGMKNGRINIRHRSLAVARSLAPQANKDSASPEKEVFLVNSRKWFRDAGGILATTKER